MRRVEAPAEFAAALESCRREARNAFGDDAVLVERYVTRPRHIEIQVFADTHGQAVYLFERDCSVQRRHQKVLEEAPAPGLSETRRREMGEAAVAAARAVGYVGAGTVEFIAEPTDTGDLRFYFMEMNTRLQVEHPVTEAITGLDLVEWQLRVAAGERLPLAQHELVRRGHAIEARVCAENPDAGFLPAIGTMSVARWPAHVRFVHDPVRPRIDTGFGEGDEISPHYDSMVAKLIVWGEDRGQALARLDAALRDTHIVGLQTNVAFLRRVAASRSFREADLDTALIERERAALFEAPPLPLEVAAAGAVAQRPPRRGPTLGRGATAGGCTAARRVTSTWRLATEDAPRAWSAHTTGRSRCRCSRPVDPSRRCACRLAPADSATIVTTSPWAPRAGRWRSTRWVNGWRCSPRKASANCVRSTHWPMPARAHGPRAASPHRCPARWCRSS